MYIQKYQKYNVLEAADKRIDFIFNNFKNIRVSISGGKDSTVLAHLMLKKANLLNRKVYLFYLDEEVVYQNTIDQIEYLMNLYPENTIRLWLQVEFNLTNATSVNESELLCWEHGKHKIWMRSKGKDNICYPFWEIKKDEHKMSGRGFYKIIYNVENNYKDTAIIIGLRATESQNRWRTMAKNPVNINDNTVFWGTAKLNNNYALYPIFDWNYHDIWKYIYDNKLKYNKIYDMMFKEGKGIREMRISSLIHEKAFASIVDLPKYEPKTYNKLLKRVKGISFAQETAKNSKMFKVRKLSKNFKSWIDYRNFLLKTFDNKEKKAVFEKRFENHLNNEHVARQQCRQLILNDFGNNIPIDNKPDPRDKLIEYYKDVL